VRSAKTKALVLIAFLAGGTTLIMIGSNAPTSLSTPYYYVMPRDSTNEVIIPPADLYTYSFLRMGAGVDTMQIWYFKNAYDSVDFYIPPNGGNERLINFSIGPAISSNLGIRVMSGDSTGLIISGGY
jgi:hypothetical protein